MPTNTSHPKSGAKIIKGGEKTPSRQVGARVLEPEAELHFELKNIAGRIRGDKALARKLLVDAGILTAKGNLRRPYQG